MPPKKIAWENWKEKVDDSPPKNADATEVYPDTESVIDEAQKQMVANSIS